MKRCMRILILLLFIGNFCSGQTSNEKLIRNLEDAQREAILKGDSTKLSQLMSHQVVVQNPENTIIGFEQIMQRIKTGKINYSAFDRIIEKVTFTNTLQLLWVKKLFMLKA